MTKLSSEYLEKLKADLLDKKAGLADQLRLLNQEDSYADADHTLGNAEDADEAYEELSHNETELKRKLLNDSIADIDQALYLMQVGTYGTCTVCGSEIDLARLDVYPEATKCLVHAA